MRGLVKNWKGNIIFSAIVLPCFIFVLLHYNNSTTDAQDRFAERFDAESNVRQTRVASSMKSHERNLDVLVAFFNASSNINAKEFHAFSQNLLGVEGVVAVCWVAHDESARLSEVSKASVEDEPCARFDMLEPSRFIGVKTPYIMLSKFASTSTPENSAGAQRGFASVVFELSSLFLNDSSDILTDYLIVNDTIQNTINAYTFGVGQVGRSSEVDLASKKNMKYAKLASFNHVNFLYLAKQEPMGKYPIQLFFLCSLLGLSSLAALYVRGLVLTKDIISQEVKLRTEELSQFAYRTSHDLRAPLVTVGGLCRAACEDLEDGFLEDLGPNLMRIESHVGRLDRLVGDILSLTRADLREHLKEEIDFTLLLDEILEHVNATFIEYDVRVDLDVRVSGTYLFSRARVFQILENLITNSIKYANPEVQHPFVRVEVTEVRQAIVIVVKDNGLGIPKEFQGRLFQMFERFHPSSSTVGSGLGLSIVKKHVDRLKGTIDVISNTQGTTVALSLPYKKEKL